VAAARMLVKRVAGKTGSQVRILFSPLIINELRLLEVDFQEIKTDKKHCANTAQALNSSSVCAESAQENNQI